MKKRVLIMIFDYGGHASLAQATKEAMEKEYPEDYDIFIENVAPKFMLTLHHTVVVSASKLWLLLYDLTNSKKVSSALNSTWTLFIQQTIEKMVRKYKPDVVIANFSLASASIRRIQKKYNLPVVIMVADPFSIHRTWFTNKDAYYYVPTREAQEIGIRNGIPQKKIVVSGWPVREQFFQPYDRTECAKRLQFDPDIFTLFLGGSVSGGVKLTQLLKNIDVEFGDERIQMVAACGTNKRVKRSLEKIVLKPQHTLSIFGYEQNVAPIMATCDVVVGKAGPNVMFEAVALNKPFFAFGAISAQEEGNVTYIKRQKIGWVESQPKKAAELIHNLARHRELLEEKQSALQQCKHFLHFDAHVVAQGINALVSQPTI